MAGFANDPLFLRSILLPLHLLVLSKVPDVIGVVSVMSSKNPNPVLSGARASLLARFRGDAHGNVAIFFALAILPILGMVGAAVDYTKANNARTALQSALDTTSLMLSKDAATLPADQIQIRARQYFDALYTHTEAPVSTFNAVYTANTGKGANVTVTASSSMNTDFVKVLSNNFQTLALNGASTTSWGSTKMRVALALDNTGSMASDGKIGALKTAATNLINTLKGTATTDGDVYISIIPFAKVVNVDAANYNANWLDWSDWETANGSCSNNFYNNQSSCVQAGKTWTPKNHNKWTGCVTDRDKDVNVNFDTLNTAPTSSNPQTLFPATEYNENNEYYCKPNNSPFLATVMPLSYDWTALTTKINSMAPTGSTNQAIGLAWAWQSLSNPPLTVPPEDVNTTYSKIIILLSDGLNTKDRWYGDGVNPAPEVDARQKILCDNIKAVKDSKGDSVYTIYTIQVNTGTPKDPTSAVLQYCATNSDAEHAIQVTSSNQIITAFDTIGASLTKLRISK